MQFFLTRPSIENSGISNRILPQMPAMCMFLCVVRCAANVGASPDGNTRDVEVKL